MTAAVDGGFFGFLTHCATTCVNWHQVVIAQSLSFQSTADLLRHRVQHTQRALLLLCDQVGCREQVYRDGQQALNGLLQSIEASLQLAVHAETWEWKEVCTKEAV
jgi:hypothetical protein